MSANAEKILQEVLNLPPHDRAEVLERLLAIFQEPPDPEVIWPDARRAIEFSQSDAPLLWEDLCQSK